MRYKPSSIYSTALRLKRVLKHSTVHQATLEGNGETSQQSNPLTLSWTLWLDTYQFSPSFYPLLWGFPSSSDREESVCNAGDPGSIPGSGEGNGNLLQYFCLENSMDRTAWWAIVHGVTKSQTRLFPVFILEIDTEANPRGKWALCSWAACSVPGVWALVLEGVSSCKGAGQGPSASSDSSENSGIYYQNPHKLGVWDGEFT